MAFLIYLDCVFLIFFSIILLLFHSWNKRRKVTHHQDPNFQKCHTSNGLEPDIITKIAKITATSTSLKTSSRKCQLNKFLKTLTSMDQVDFLVIKSSRCSIAMIYLSLWMILTSCMIQSKSILRKWIAICSKNVHCQKNLIRFSVKSLPLLVKIIFLIISQP